ncbi:MAG: tryptophan-rich sensory protein [Bacteroidales bacterium]|jgi:tryptophan-rich sensory protein|nr:tryptophan-rich sensory protein [Bacteroidales bacterium]MDD4603162.1 tryptophan-rich sensory protein [Bacteroidales bacterium]
MKPSRILTLVVCIALPLVVGSISGIATVENVTTWYITLNKPIFNPPGYLFGPVWTLLYILMGISLFLIWTSVSGPLRTQALWVFGVQLILNFAWSFIFFHFHQPGWAFAEIILIWTSIILMILAFYRISKTAACLQIPYLLWASFASILNGSIWILN